MSLSLPVSDLDADWTRNADEDPQALNNFASIGLGTTRTLGSSVTATWNPPEGYIAIAEGADSTTGSWRYQLCARAVESTYTAFDTDSYTAQAFEFWVARLNRSDYSLDSWIDVSPDEPKLSGSGLGNFREAKSPEQSQDYATNGPSFGGARARSSDGLDTANTGPWVESGDLQGEVHGVLWLPGDRLMLRVASANQIAVWDLTTGNRIWQKESFSQIPENFVKLHPDTDPTSPPWGSGFSASSALSFSTTAWDVLAQISDTTVLVLEELRKWKPIITSDLDGEIEWELEEATWEGGADAGITAFGSWVKKWVYDSIGSNGLSTVPPGEETEIPSFGYGSTDSAGGKLPGKPNQYELGLSGAAAPLPASYTQHESLGLAEAELDEIEADFAIAADVSRYQRHACTLSTLTYKEINFLTGVEVSSFTAAEVDEERSTTFLEPTRNRFGKSILQTTSWGNISALALSPHPDSQCYVTVEDGEGNIVPDRTPGTNEQLNGFFLLPAAPLNGYEGGSFQDATDPNGNAASYIWHISGSEADPADVNDRTQYQLFSSNSGSLSGLVDNGKRLFPTGQHVFRNTGGDIENPPYPVNSTDPDETVEWAAGRIYHPVYAGEDEHRFRAKPLPHHSGKLVVYDQDTLIFLPRDRTRVFSYLNPGNTVPPTNEDPELVSAHNDECRWAHNIVCYKRDPEDATAWLVAWSLNTHDLWPPPAPIDETDALDHTIGDCPTNGFALEDGRLYTVIKGASGHYAIRVPVIDIEGATTGLVEQSLKIELGGRTINPDRTDFKDALVLGQRDLILCVSEGSDTKFIRLGI